MPGLDLTPTLRVHPVALNVARLVNKEGTIRLDVFNEEDEAISRSSSTPRPGSGSTVL